MEIKISKELKERCPRAALLVICYEAEVAESSQGLLDLRNKQVDQLRDTYTMAAIAEIPHIRDTREAYLSLGKSPSKYRNASEAMLRRIVKGNGLYNINNVVEINNLISVSTGYSIGSYEVDCLEGEVAWQRAPEGECYQGIGKDQVNIEFLPTLYDGQGAFGNPTSDSQRAMIRSGKRHIVSVIYSFSGKDEFETIAERYSALLSEYCSAENIQTEIFE